MKKILDEIQAKTREKKQKYLREEIIEKGLSAESFSDYLKMEKKDGEDIDSWEFDELEF